MLWAALTLLLTIIIKGAGFLVHITGQSRPPAHTLKDVSARLPCVSVMTPLFHEPEIADALIKRLENLTYPKPLLDIVLVLEAADEITRTALQRIQLPSWIKVVVVPDAKGLTTKPRAMNYALDFCRGTIIGVWDAEDAPEPDQIEKVAARFNEAAPNVVACKECLIISMPAKTGFPVVLQLNMQRGGELYYREWQGLGSSYHWGEQHCSSAEKPLKNWGGGMPTTSQRTPISACALPATAMLPN